MKFKYLYECKNLSAFNRVRTSGSLRGIEILASRKHQTVLSERLIPLHNTNDVRLYVFAPLDWEDIKGL